MRKVCYAALESTDGKHVCVAVYHAKAHVRDGRVRAIALGEGRVVQRYKLCITVLEAVPYVELAKKHETPEYPAFDWSMAQDWDRKGYYKSRLQSNQHTRKTTDFSND